MSLYLIMQDWDIIYIMDVMKQLKMNKYFYILLY